MKFDWSARCIIRLGTCSTCCTHFPVVLDPRSNHSTCARTRGKAEQPVRILLGMQFCMHRTVAWEEKHYALVEYTRRTFSYVFYCPPNGKEISNTYGHTLYYVTTRTVADRMKKKYICTNIKQNKTYTPLKRLPWLCPHTEKSQEQQPQSVLIEYWA